MMEFGDRCSKHGRRLLLRLVDFERGELANQSWLRRRRMSRPIELGLPVALGVSNPASVERHALHGF